MKDEKGGGSKRSAELRLERWALGLFRVVQEIWEWDPGGKPAEKASTGIWSATGGLAAALGVGVVFLLEGVDYFSEAARALEALGMGAVWAPAVAFGILVVGIAAVSLFFGRIIYLSSSDRSYIGHAWQGAALVFAGVVLVCIAWMVISVVRMVG